MSRLLCLAVAAGAWLAVGATGAAAQPAEGHGGHELEMLMIQEASTPAQHEALAAHFRAAAAEAKAQSARHKAMAAGYSNPKFAASKKHCENLADLYAKQAVDYEELAKAHAAQAGS
jgi:hypothetical protein